MTPWIGPHRSTSSVQRQSSMVVSAMRANPPTPALLHSTCTAPNSATAASANASTSSSRVTSVRTAIACPPRSRSSVAACSSGSSRAVRQHHVHPGRRERAGHPQPDPRRRPRHHGHSVLDSLHRTSFFGGPFIAGPDDHERPGQRRAGRRSSGPCLGASVRDVSGWRPALCAVVSAGPRATVAATRTGRCPCRDRRSR